MWRRRKASVCRAGWGLKPPAARFAIALRPPLGARDTPPHLSTLCVDPISPLIVV